MPAANISIPMSVMQRLIMLEMQVNQLRQQIMNSSGGSMSGGGGMSMTQLYNIQIKFS
ncbi:hypothetical protein [Clostridium magnum]|uniref:Uncharacterized protein n=1 Tax=Clostridium magnum DSM 2767 TaxID=1121326 RepID=A0A161YQ10_9CLOT|nr:hypothetical protein [Clostridium magnum]KZL92902.1 hypothetical protein CLMAG_27160 [Clostridium magnum DSM 2767]